MPHEKITEVTTVSRQPQERLVTTREVSVPSPKLEEHAESYETKKAIFRTYQVVWYVLGVIEVLLASRILLKLVGANPMSPFVNFIYMLSEPFAYPFQGILGTSVASTSVVEWSTLVAMVVYFVLAQGLIELMKFVKPTTPAEVSSNVDSV